MESYRFTKTDLSLLDKFMKENGISNKTEALRECIKRSVVRQDIDSLIFDLNNKMNRIIHNQYLTKKLLEQFYANMEFPVDQDVKTEAGLKRFYENNNFYLNKIMD